MALALNLVLDERGCARIQELRNRLRASGLPASDVPAHLTIAVLEAGDPAALAQAFAGPPPPTLRLVHLGVFLGPPGVAFAGVAPTADLVRLHDQTWDAVAGVGQGWALYQPGWWVPHVTLAMPLTPDEVGRSVTALADADLPCDVGVAALAVLDLATGATVGTAWPP